MGRAAYMVGLILLIGAGAWIAKQLICNPIQPQRAALEVELTEVKQPLDVEEKPSTPPYRELQETIKARTSLWDGLVPPPVVQEREPDWQSILKGVEATRSTVGVGADMKVGVRTPHSRRMMLSVGSVLNGATVKEITSTAIVFSKEANGKEHTYALPR